MARIDTTPRLVTGLGWVTPVWTVTTDRYGHRAYVRADGTIIAHDGAGRMSWTVYYPGGDYGMTDTMGEALAWAGE